MTAQPSPVPPTLFQPQSQRICGTCALFMILYLAIYLAHLRNIHHYMERKTEKKGIKPPIRTHPPGSAEKNIIQDSLALTQ